jgi:hypothetical protein
MVGLDIFTQGELYGINDEPAVVEESWTVGNWIRVGSKNCLLCYVEISGTLADRIDLQLEWTVNLDQGPFVFDVQSYQGSGEISVEEELFKLNPAIGEKTLRLIPTKNVTCRLKAKRVGGDATTKLYVFGHAREPDS